MDSISEEGGEKEYWVMDGSIASLPNPFENPSEFCRLCGKCCCNLTFYDKAELSGALGKFILSSVCKYRSSDGCKIYDERPQCCKDWTCGVIDWLKEQKEQENLQSNKHGWDTAILGKKE